MKKTIRFAFALIIYILPIGYALYTRDWQPLLLATWGMIGVFAGAFEAFNKTNQ
jgi:hypothetical protein